MNDMKSYYPTQHPQSSPPPRRVHNRNKGAAALLALFLGGIGIHKFYLGQAVQGIFYFLFCWTLIPGLIALVEVFLLAFMDDREFDRRFNII